MVRHRPRARSKPRVRPAPRVLRKRALAASAAALVLLLCIYRILTFVPRALDSPRTLRPILYAIFSIFVRHYGNPELAQQAWEKYCLAALFVPVILALLNYMSSRSAIRLPEPVRRVAGSRVLLFASVALCLTICRFPFFLTGEINPDETLFLVAAHKLFRDPIFFRAVDCGTSGPLNIFPLMLPALVGISPDYASARLTTLAIILISIYVVYRALALLADDATARIAILPAAGVFAAVKIRDFLHYSSEDVSILLLAVALYLCVRIFRRPESHTWNLAGLGLLTGAAFLAKMQTVPIVGCVALLAAAYVHARGEARHLWRPAFLVAGGSALLPLLNAAICVAAGVWHIFWMEYLVANYTYVQARGPLTSELTSFVNFVNHPRIQEIRLQIVTLLAVLVAYAWQRTRRSVISGQALFLQTATIGGIAAVAADLALSHAGAALLGYAGLFSMVVLPGSFFLLCRERDTHAAPAKWFGFLAATLLAMAAWSIYVPHNPYRHYLLLLLLPLAIAMAWPVVADFQEAEPVSGGKQEPPSGRNFHSSVPFVLVFAALTLTGQVFVVGSPDLLGFAQVPQTVRVPESAVIASLTPQGEEIAVWGWNARLYLGAGRTTTTRDIDVANLFYSSPAVQAFYREDYLSSLRRHLPALFIDAIDTSPGGFANQKVFGFQVLPALDSFVQSHYVPVLDAYRERFYIRDDLARSVAGIGPPRKCAARAIRCFEAGAKSWAPTDLPPIQMPEHALLETEFTPEAPQTPYATVFSNSASTTATQGFEFQHAGNDRYRLAIGCGSQFAFSQELTLPQRTPASLALEFSGRTVTISLNGVKRDEMQLPARMADSAGPITVGSWVGRRRPFLGNIQFFQIRDLGRKR